MQLACWVLLAGATSMVGWVFCRMAAAAFRALYEPPALVLPPPRRRACVSALVPVALCPGVHAAATEARRRSRAGGGGGRGNMRVGRVGGVAVAAAHVCMYEYMYLSIRWSGMHSQVSSHGPYISTAAMHCLHARSVTQCNFPTQAYSSIA